MATQTFTVASYLADSANWPYPTGDVIRIVDTSAHLSGLTAGDIAGFGTNHVDLVNASDNVLSWDVSQWQAVPTGLGFDIDDLKIVYDTGAHLAGLSTTDLGHLNTYGVTQINPSDGVLSLGADQYAALGGISIDQDATVTLSDTGADISGLSSQDFTNMSIKGIDVIDASDNAVSLTVDQLHGLGTVAIDASDTVTVADTSGHLEALSVGEIGALGAQGVTIVDATDDVLHLTVAQGFAGLYAGLNLTDADTVTVLDTGANIAVVDASDMANLGDDGFDIIDASDNKLSLHVDQAEALYGSGVSLTQADVVTLADTGSNLGELSAATLANLGEFGVDVIDATDNAVSFSISQLSAIGANGITLTAADTVTLSDTGGAIGEFNAGDITDYGEQGVDIIDAYDDAPYSTNVATAQAMLTTGLIFAGNDSVTLSDTGAHIAALTTAEIGDLAAAGYDIIDASDDALSLSLAQFDALGDVSLTDSDTVTAYDTGAHFAALSAAQITAYSDQGMDIIDASDDVLNFTVAQFNSIVEGEIGLTYADYVTVLDTGAHIAGISASDMATLGDLGFDLIDATDNGFTLRVDQASAMAGSGVALASNDVVTISDTGANLQALSAGELGSLGSFGFDKIDATNDVLSFNVAQAEALGGETGLIIVAADDATVTDTGANIQAMSASQIAALAGAGFDHIDSTTDILSLTVDQVTSLGTVTLTSADVVTLADTSANIQGMSDADFAQLSVSGVDKIDATDNVLALTVAQYGNLLGVKLTGADTVTIRDTGVNLATLDFSTLASAKIDAIDATDNILNINVSQFLSLGAVSLAAGDLVTLTDTSAHIGAMTSAQLSSLGGKGVDAIDSTDDVLTLALTQFNNLGSVVLTSADLVTVTATGAQIAALGTSKLAQMNTAHVDVLDATDGSASVSISQLDAMGSIKFAANDAITLYDSAANLSAMTTGYIAGLAARGVDVLNSSNDYLHLSAAQIAALGTVALDGHGYEPSGPIHLDSPSGGAGADYITELDTGANIAAQSTAVLAGLYNLGVDQIDATDNVLNLSVAKFLALNVYFYNPEGPIHQDY